MSDMGEPKDVNDEKARVGRHASIREIVWRGLLREPDGRKFCYELLEWGHIFHSSYRSDTNATFFAEGERNYALRLNVEMIGAEPKLYALMLQEAQARADNPRKTNGRSDSSS